MRVGAASADARGHRFRLRRADEIACPELLHLFRAYLLRFGTSWGNRPHAALHDRSGTQKFRPFNSERWKRIGSAAGGIALHNRPRVISTGYPGNGDLNLPLAATQLGREMTEAAN